MVGGPRDRVGGLAIEGDVLTHPVWVGQPPIDRLQQCNFSFNMFAQKNANDIKSLDKRSFKLRQRSIGSLLVQTSHLFAEPTSILIRVFISHRIPRIWYDASGVA